MQERGRSGTPTLGFRSRSCVCSPWMRCGIDPDKLSVGQSNDDQDGSKPMVGTTNRSMAWPQRSPPGRHGTVLPKHQWRGQEPIFEGTDATYTITCVPTSTTRPVGIWKNSLASDDPMYPNHLGCFGIGRVRIIDNRTRLLGGILPRKWRRDIFALAGVLRGNVIILLERG